jgi:putative nucleotidyltransferase with HDIG domain
MAKQKQGSRETLKLRSKYIDHSLRFLDWVNDLGFERTRLGRMAQGADETFQVRKLSIAFLFSLMLAGLIYYDFDFSYSVSVNEIATRDIKSPLNMDMVDEVATEEKRKVAERATAIVFDYDRTMFEEIYGAVYTSFRKMREDMRATTLSKDDFVRFDQIKKLFDLKPEFEKILAHKVSDQVFEWLVQNRFNPRIESEVMQTLDKWADRKIVDGSDKLFAEGHREIIMRELSRGARGHEASVSASDLYDRSRLEEFPVKHPPISRTYTSTDHRLFEEFVHSLITPNMTLNRQETETRRQRARDEVLPVSISIKKNQIIVPQGSKIKPLQVSILGEIENQRSGRNRNFVVLVASVMFVVMMLVFSSYLRRFTLNRVKVNGKEIVVMGAVVLSVVAITKFFIFLTNTAFSSTFGTMIPESAFLYAAPSAAGAMLVGLLITAGEVVWIFSLFIAVVLGLMVDQKFSYMLVTIIGSLAAARGVYGCKARNDLYFAGLRTGLVNALMILLTITVQHFGDETLMRELLWTVPAGLVSGILSSLVAMMLIPMLESIFNITTDVKLLELSNLNHPLLKEMIVRAPGTYHHSLVVGSMVEAAAEEIGANPLLAKVMSYYHDIGKTQHAQYFIENQKPGNNPHDHLSPHMSKTILIAHVKDGVELGVEHKLGKPIIDGIVQHHGTTLIAFFYNRAVEQHDEAIDEVAEDDFRYPGPKPQFREAALIMLADSIEAASRSLDEPTPTRLQNIVKNIIQRKFMDGQLDECNLTLKDLSIIEESFIKILNGIYHQRIDYPKRAGGGMGDSSGASVSAGSTRRAAAGAAGTNVLPGPGAKK